MTTCSIRSGAPGAGPREELRSASDAVIDDAVKYTDPMVLRGLLYQLTGDEEVRAIEAAPLGAGGAYSPGGILIVADEGDVRTLQAKAAAFLKAYRDAGAGDPSIRALAKPGPYSGRTDDEAWHERLIESLGLTAGEELPEAERAMWLEQTALDPFVRGVTWKAPPAADKRQGFTVGIIGSGLSGLDAAVHLKRAGIPFVVLEKNAEVGGTWFENQYPGARVDSPSRSYTHLFGVSFPYPYNFCPRDENMKYMHWVADHFGLREHDRVQHRGHLGRSGTRRRRCGSSRRRRPQGRRTWRFNAVISCVGFLSRPNMPEIEGMDKLRGAVLPHGAMARRPRRRGQARRGDRLGRVRLPDDARAGEDRRSTSTCSSARRAGASRTRLYVSPLPEQSVWLDRNFPYYAELRALPPGLAVRAAQRRGVGAGRSELLRTRMRRAPRTRRSATRARLYPNRSWPAGPT